MKGRRNTLLLCGVLIALISVAAFTIKRASFGAQDEKVAIRHQRREARYSTPRFNEWREPDRRWSLLPDGSANSVHIDNVETEDPDQPAALARMQNEYNLESKKLICASDVTLKGEVLKSQGVITDDDLFIYTIYTFLVTEVVRSNVAGVSVKRDGQIEFTMPGGKALVGGKKTVTFYYPSHANLVTNDQYILHLRYDPEADDYYVDSRLGVYFIGDEGKTTRMDAKIFPFFERRARLLGLPDNVAAVTADIQSAACK